MEIILNIILTNFRAFIHLDIVSIYNDCMHIFLTRLASKNSYPVSNLDLLHREYVAEHLFVPGCLRLGNAVAHVIHDFVQVGGRQIVILENFLWTNFINFDSLSTLTEYSTWMNFSAVIVGSVPFSYSRTCVGGPSSRETLILTIFVLDS